MSVSCMDLRCDRWKRTMAEKFEIWYKSIANLPNECKSLLKEAGDDTERYQAQLDREKTLIDPITITVHITGKKVSRKAPVKAPVDINLSQSQLDTGTIRDFVQAIEPYIGKRCLIREHFGSYEYGSICLEFNGRSIGKLSYGLLLSSLVRDGELPYFYVRDY